MIALHKDLYWNVRKDHEDKNFVYIWRYTPTDKCTERVTEEGVTVYEKHLRTQVVELMDISFGAITYWLAFGDACPVDDEYIRIGTALDSIAAQCHFEPARIHKGRAVYWTTTRRYDECQGFYLDIIHYQPAYLKREDINAFTKEKQRVSKEEWIPLYHQLQELKPPEVNDVQHI